MNRRDWFYAEKEAPENIDWIKRRERSESYRNSEGKIEYPTTMELKDRVLVDFFNGSGQQEAELRSVIFNHKKVRFDVALFDIKGSLSTVKNLDSCSVSPKDERKDVIFTSPFALGEKVHVKGNNAVPKSGHIEEIIFGQEGTFYDINFGDFVAKAIPENRITNQ